MATPFRFFTALSLIAGVAAALDYLRRLDEKRRLAEEQILEEAIQTFENEGGLVAG